MKFQYLLIDSLIDFLINESGLIKIPNRERIIMNNESFKKKQRFNPEGRLIDFSVLITAIVESMPNTRAGNYYTDQLIRSGTSPARSYGKPRFIIQY